MGIDAIPQKTHCWRTRAECSHVWSRVNDTLTATSSPLPVVHYSGMKEQPLQTQRKTALLPKAVNRKKKKKKKAVHYLYNKTDIKHVQWYIKGSHRLCYSCLMLWSQMWPKLQNWSTQLGLVMDLDTQAEDNVTLANLGWEAQEAQRKGETHGTERLICRQSGWEAARRPGAAGTPYTRERSRGPSGSLPAAKGRRSDEPGGLIKKGPKPPSVLISAC